MKFLFLLLLVLPSISYGQAVYKGQAYNSPVCNSPNCGMCNQIRAQLAQQSIPSTAYNPTPLQDTEYETVQVPITKRVKHCNGVTCWYENVTTYRTERRPIRNAIDKINLLRVTDLVPTPHTAVMEMLVLASPKPNEVLYDLGCGDGRILIEATWNYGCRSVGIELNKESFKQATASITNFGLIDRIKLYQGDILNYTYPDADVVTMYLYPELMAKVLPRLRPGTRVVSYLHPIPGGTKHVVRNFTFYTWTVQ